jgi:hypothetical protein
MKKLLSLAALSLLSAAPLAAQGVAGNWLTEFDRMIRNEGGAVSTGEKTRVKMSLVQTGDSVTGTWEAVGDLPNRTATSRPLKGTVSGNKVMLTAEFTATVNRNGEQAERRMMIVYDLALNGDKLEGTMTTRSGDMDMPARPFSAWREGSAKK